MSVYRSIEPTNRFQSPIWLSRIAQAQRTRCAVRVVCPRTAYLSFYDSSPGTLKYASASYNSANDSWAWQVESIDGSSSLDVGEYSAITIDESGVVFIAYYDATNGNLKIAHN